MRKAARSLKERKGVLLRSCKAAGPQVMHALGMQRPSAHSPQGCGAVPTELLDRCWITSDESKSRVA